MVKLYIESMKLKLKSQLEYRLSFILTFISQIGVFFTYYFMTVALFQRFDNIKGFTLSAGVNFCVSEHDDIMGLKFGIGYTFKTK